VSVFIWGWLLGAIGAILAIPLTMLIITIMESFSTTRWLARLMSYVPGSEKAEDAEAVDKAKGFLSKMKERIPMPQLNQSSTSVEVVKTSKPESAAPDVDTDEHSQ
jgi:hypothetical protein